MMESDASTNTNGMGRELAEFFFVGDVVHLAAARWRAALMFDSRMHFVSPEMVPSDK